MPAPPSEPSDDPNALLRLEAGMLQSFAPEDEDVEGLIAFALHRRACLDWAEAFLVSQKRAPGLEETQHFLLGETTPRRIADYRERAALLVSLRREEIAPVAPQKPPTRKKKVFPWGPGLAFVVEQPTGPLNLKLLMLRLGLLLLAVVATALLLRVFVVHA